MSKILSTAFYTKDHEWVLLKDNTATVGVSDHAQQKLGDVVFVELPQENQSIKQGESCAVIESVKAASDIYAPLSGEVFSPNSALEEHLDLVNTDPYGKGFLFKIKNVVSDELQNLMTAAEYQVFLKT